MGVIFKSLTFGGINSLDYGIYITGEAVYNAPERSVTSIEIEGRNGDLLIDNGRFLNIEIKYPAGCFAETQEDFKQKIESFRNAIISQISYQRLTDDYNPDEYRFAVYKSGLDVSVAVLHQGGEFDLTFDCKPQRFLTAGETEKNIPDWSDVHSDSGSIVTVDNSGGEYAVKSLSTDIVPQQDLNGYDNPWAGGAGKNKIDDFTETTCCEKVSNHKYKVTKTGTTIGTRSGSADSVMKSGTEYTISYNADLTNISINIATRVQYTDSTYSSNLHTSTSGDNSFTFTPTKDVKLFQFYLGGGDSTGIDQYVIITNLMARVSSDTSTTFEPYENICPITGFTGANIYVSPTTSVGDATTYLVSWSDSAGTVYGGTLNVLTGALTVTHGIKTISELSWTYNSQYTRFQSSISGILRTAQARTTTMKSSEYVCVDDGRTLNLVPNGAIYAAGTSDSIYITDYRYTDATTFSNEQGSQTIVYPLNTQLTYQLTATQVAFLLGTNNIWSNTGDIQIEYGKGGNTLFNPTLFDSKPLLVVTGYGNLGIGSQTLTIENGYPSQVVYIDCDSMEAWTESGGVKSPANDLIQNAGDAFPVLKSGVNVFSLPVTITSLKVTPRWWRI